MERVTTKINNDTTPSMVSYFITAGLFGYFALGFDKDPDACYASPEHTLRWVSGSKEGYREIG